MPTGSNAPLQPSFQTSRILHAALVASLLIYAVVVHVLLAVGALAPILDAWQAELARWVVFALAALGLGAVLVARGRLLSEEAVVALGRRGDSRAALAALQQRLIILLACSEAVAIFGLVLFLLSGDLFDFYVPWALGLAGHLALTPRRERWDLAAGSQRGR